MERTWRVGELADATGVTVRTLHHFDDIGLVRPAGRSGAGHRRYVDADVRRLYQVLALRQVGMPLGEIGRALDGDLRSAVTRQIEQLERAVDDLRPLRRRLIALRAAMSGPDEPSIDQLLSTMEAMMNAGFFTPEQLATLRQRHHEAGDRGFAKWKERWGELVAEVSAHLAAGVDVADPAAQETARKWASLMDRLTGSDRSVIASMYAKMDAEGAAVATRGVVGDEVWAYVKRCFAVGFSG